MGAPFDDVLIGLEPEAALRCLVLAWRGAPHESITAEIAARSAQFEALRDWDLDRFDITTLPQVLSWMLDSGPFSPQLEQVLDSIEPYLPDPRAVRPLASLAAKVTRVHGRAKELAQRHPLPGTSLEQGETLRHLRAVVADEQQRGRRVAELMVEASLERRAVLADWFMSRADPLGEFVGLQLAHRAPVDDGGPEERPSGRELWLWRQYGVAWIGMFLGQAMALGMGSKVREAVQFVRGVPLQVKGLERAVEHARAPGWRHVKKLALLRVSQEQEFAGDLSHAVAHVEQLDAHLGTLLDLLDRTRCEALRELTVRGAGTTSWAELERLVHRIPALREVHFDRAGAFETDGLEATLRSLRARSVSITLQIHHDQLTIPFEGAPVLAVEKYGPEWAAVIEVVHGVIARRPTIEKRERPNS